jgi:hypothetical protein
MIIRNSVLFSLGLLAIFSVESAARPSIPSPESPPITAQFGATYYSNIAGSSAAFASARGLKRADVVYNPAVNVALVEPMGGISFFVTGQAGYDFHQVNTNLNGERIGLQGGADAQLSACDATVSGAWFRNQSNQVDLIVGNAKNINQRLSAELDAVCNQSGDIVPAVSVIQTWTNNSALLYVPSDYHSLAVSGSVLYKAGSFGQVSLIGQYVQTTYPHRIFILGIGAQSDGYNLYAGGVHFERDFGSAIHFGASVSETSLSPSNGVGAGFHGITYDASVAYRPTARLSFSLLTRRETTPSDYLNAAYSVNEVYSGEADYKISSRLTAALGASQTHSNFGGAALLRATDITVQTLRSFYGTLGFNLSPTFSVSLNAGQDQRHSNVLGYNYSGGHVGVAVMKAF